MMKNNAPETNHHPNPRQIVWTLITIIFVISLIFSGMALYNYTEIARASILTYVTTDETTILTFDNASTLKSVNLTLDFTIFNPSQKELKVWIITYKGWLRDIPLEDGTDTSRWIIDGRWDENGTEKKFYPVFVATYSFDQPSVIVPAMSNITLTKYLEVNQDNYPDILSNIASIYNHTSDLGIEMEWLQYTSSTLFIEGIPSYSGANHDANVIKRFDGVDITPGVGGAS